MCALSTEAMDCGAVGLSSGLIYPAGSYGPTEAHVALNRKAAAREGSYVVQQREEVLGIDVACDERSHIDR